MILHTGARLPTDLRLLRSTASFKNKLKSFYVSCCLHLEHCVNSGMRHPSACRGRTTSHCCYCYCYCNGPAVKPMVLQEVPVVHYCSATADEAGTGRRLRKTAERHAEVPTATDAATPVTPPVSATAHRRRPGPTPR